MGQANSQRAVKMPVAIAAEKAIGPKTMLHASLSITEDPATDCYE